MFQSVLDMLLYYFLLAKKLFFGAAKQKEVEEGPKMDLIVTKCRSLGIHKALLSKKTSRMDPISGNGDKFSKIVQSNCMTSFFTIEYMNFGKRNIAS